MENRTEFGTKTITEYRTEYKTENETENRKEKRREYGKDKEQNMEWISKRNTEWNKIQNDMKTVYRME